ncbi:MAG: FmdB family zinc ribbon protein [Gemmatimonadota bacterium]
MPTYEYVCRACGHEFEEFQRMSDAPVEVCPKCEEKAVDRLISIGGGIVFKGSGFYATDYRKEAPPKESGEDKGSGSKTSGDGESATSGSGGSASKSPAGGADAPKKGGSD